MAGNIMLGGKAHEKWHGERTTAIIEGRLKRRSTLGITFERLAAVSKSELNAWSWFVPFECNLICCDTIDVCYVEGYDLWVMIC